MTSSPRMIANRARYLREAREPAPFILESTADMMDAAAAEIIWLRSVISVAPHEDGCNLYAPSALRHGEGCNCWKALSGG